MTRQERKRKVGQELAVLQERPDGEQNKTEQSWAIWLEGGADHSIAEAREVLRPEQEWRGNARGPGGVNAASPEEARGRNGAHAEPALTRRRHLCVQLRRELQAGRTKAGLLK